MRKQTKLVAVASAAALLAIGASMTSFAATGWVEEGGEWFFYEKDGSKAEDTWKKSGDKWFWLDSEEDGAMAIDKLIEDGDNTYYVDSTGAMVSNTWVKVVNEEQDDDDDPAEYNYYYMQNNGKAYTAGDSGVTKFRTIDGKRYAFDDDGKMLYGWVNDSGNRMTGDSEWETATYYLGSWDDGAMKTGWQNVYVYDDSESDDMNHWFHFKSNGKKRIQELTDGGNVKEVKINGKRYGFDDRGVMVYEWTLATGGTASRSDVSAWKYFSSPEDGARLTKGWFKVIAPTEDNSFKNVITGNPTTGNTFDKGNAEDETDKWYYADGSGNLYADAIKKIKGKYYGFHPNGYMLNGLVYMDVNPVDGTINRVYDSGVDADELDDIISGDGYKDVSASTLASGIGSLYYFGSNEDSDGAMKTGATTVTLDGESYNFLFNKSGGVESKGRGLTGIDDGKYIYRFGMKLKAGSDDRYMLVHATGDTGSASATATKVKSADLRDDAGTFKNDDKETVRFVSGNIADVSFAGNGYYDTGDVYLVNTSGAIQKSKTAAKDGDEWYFYVYDKEVKLYTNNKNIDPLDTAQKDVKGWKDWSVR